ncbi:3-dehydroquinate synthase [Aliikangiella sp. G2MR2-5]|uniref:3-dehydroquinate synthase n=1 Tax=Aliikangiella sp. G2MR2-5 TaxID=2788943 RepID=UPI0018AA897C|nr:3-dehydroquinate synthase [Aliikangiella sp. G2MR2-5]
MRSLKLELGERSYSILIAPGLLAKAGLIAGECEGEKVLILTNQVVGPLYCDSVRDALSNANKKIFEFVIPDGEVEKSLENFSKALDFLIENQFRRNDTILALGGGVVGDLSGFIAASYQRGMRFIQLPTTLLSQVDSSVGGKTGVNHPQAKNMIGAFYQPRLVVIDTDTLKSLPEREYLSGLAEVVKYAILGESNISEALLNQTPAILARDAEIISLLIELSCRKKAQVVADDEKELGARALLNLGHTFGHAIEKLTEYRRYLHGEAVAIGIQMAISLSLTKNLIHIEKASEYRRILEKLGLPEVAEGGYSVEDMLESMKLDKKNLSDKYRLVLPRNNDCIIVEEEDSNALREAIGAHLA